MAGDAEYWGWGVKKFTPEEQAEYDKQWSAASGQSTGGGQQAEEGYYSGPMQAAEPVTVQPEVEQPIEEPKPSTHYLADPQNFAEVWSRFDQDPNYEDEHYSREQVNALYDYYSYRNQGKTMDQWGPLMDNDEFVTKEIEKNNWYDPVREQEAQQAAAASTNPVDYNPTDPAKQAMMEQKELGDWNNLDWIGKFFASVTTTDQGLGNMPSWTEKTQGVAQALSSAMAGPAMLKVAAAVTSMFGGGAAAAAIANPIVLGAAALVTGGLTFYQAVTHKEIPIFNKFLELSDLMDTVTEHTLGFGAQAIEVGKQKIQAAREDPNDAYGLLGAIHDTLRYVGQHAGSMWDTGEYFYEMEGSIGDFAVDALKEIFKGEEGTKQGEAWFFNRGINEKQQLAEGTYGAAGMTALREIDEDLKAMGVEKDLRQSLIQQWVINASGTSGNVSDYVAQSLIDVGILTTPIENEAMGAVSRITGDTNGIEATARNRGNMATQLPFVGQIYQALSGEKAPGGVMEWIDQRRDLARTTDASKLTAADRFFGGIDKDGKIQQFARTEKTGPADLLPESKVIGVGNIANTVMNTYMYDVKDVADIRNRLASMAGEAEPGTEYRTGMDNTPEVLTVRDGIRYAIQETNPEIFIQQYELSEGARNTLARTAQDLGMEISALIDLCAESPDVLEQRLRNYAAQHNGMAGGMDISQDVTPLTEIIRGFSTAKDGKGQPLAWNIETLQYEITSSMIDSMAKYYTEYYGIKPNSVVNTVFDTMKSAQSLLLLGWSPSYFINNVVNNAVTAAAEGVMGFMSPRQIRQWMQAFGVAPARFDVDTNAEFRGQDSLSRNADGLEKFSRAVAEAKKSGDDKVTQRLLKEINGVLRQTNDKLGIFSKLSGQMETLQGNQLTTVAIQQYWRRQWKQGVGYHLMPDSLVEAIERQTPGMTDVIYTAINNGLNMDQITQRLYGNQGYIRPDARQVMADTCRQQFRGDPNVYEELFEKSGMMAELARRYENCKTEEERRAVINDVADQMAKYEENRRREQLIERANNVAVEVEANGLAPVAQIMIEMETNHSDFWIQSRKEWGDVKKRINEQNLDSKEARALQTDLAARQDKAWADLYKQEVSTAAGIMQGLGFQNESHARYIGLMNENNQNWQTFNDEKRKELQRYYDRVEKIRAAAGKGKKADSVQLNEAWEDCSRNTAELYERHFQREQELQTRMDQAFVEGYEFSTQKSGEQLRQNFQRIREIRQRMHDMQQDAHAQTAKMNREEQAAFYETFNPQYDALIRDLANIGEANVRVIDNTDGQTYEDHSPVTMTPEATVQAEHIMEVNNTQREQAMRERQGYLDRDAIREGWIEAGRTPAEADLMMAIFDAAAETWALNNGAYPDEFYTQAVQLKGIATWLPGTDRKAILQTANGESVKIDTIRPADINTDNFRAWFGNSKVVDENGKPMVVYHGTAEQFDTFKKQKANDNLGRSMGLGLGKNKFYLTTERAAGEAFANSAVSMGRGKSPQVMELYLSMQKPMTQTEYESRLAEKYSQYEHSNPRQEGYDYRQRDKAIAALDKEIRAEGYDGIWDQESGQIAVYEPTQIKSIYNGGEWSRVNPNVLNQTVEQFVSENYEQLEELHNQVIEMSKDPAKQITIEGLDDADWQAMAGDGTIQLYDVDVVKIFLKGGDEIEEHKSEANDIVLKALYDKLASGEIDGFEITTLDGKLTYYFTRGFYGGEVRKTSWDAKGPISHSEYNSFNDFRHDGNSLNGEQIRYYTDVSLFQKVADPESLYQDAREIAKGSLEHTDIGNIIRMLEASDVSTMAHESGHLFRRTLSQPLLQEFTTWAGFESVGEFQELEAKFWANDPDLSDADRTRYEDAEEKFARGFEQYLMDGSAPTAGLKAVFKQFQMYLFSIYKKVKAHVTGNDYSGEEAFVFHGKTGDQVLNINAEINGVKLRDIFDRMLTDNPDRIPGYTELVQEHRTKLAQDRHNMRQSPKALSRRAQVEVNHKILQHFGSLQDAMNALAAYDLPLEIDGMKVDDATLWEAIHAAQEDPQMDPFSKAEWHQITGTQTYGYSITNANSGKKYQMRYKVVELSDLQPSNIWFGDQLVINEEYPGDVQARDRSANQADVWSHAANLNPGLLLDEQRAIDSGAPIVGEGNMFVESGNGRVLSMMKAQQDFPEQWANYQEALRNIVGDYGIDPAELDSFENPVLIRERLGGDGVEFAEDANSNRNKVMTASENALTDANKVNMVTLSNLDIQPGEGTDTFTTEKNAQPAVEWLRSMPEMERARYSTTNRNGDLILSADGQTRFINALFATLYATPESMDIIRSFSETADSNIQAVESALKQTLPEMARAEGLIRSGSRAESLSITADVMAAAGLLQEARKAGINIHDYLAQSVIPGMERWTPTQALLAGFFGDAKNNVRMLRDFFNAYGEEVYKAGDPNQLSLFGDSKTREQMINDSLDAAINKKQAAGSSQQSVQTDAAAGPSPAAPSLKQSVLDSDGKWSSEFAKVLDENLQRTFDDGMAVPLTDADGVFLKGEQNNRYQTMVQRWVRDFSNDRNMSSDQYLYAWAYLEWWVKGSEGEAPIGNPVWESDIQKAIMQDFAEEHADLVSELKRRYKKGAEVDPGSVPAKGEYVKRVYEFEHGFWDVAGNVYRDGKLVAYLPEQLDKMKRAIEVDGETYQVLGVDLQDPEGLVYYDPLLDITRTVIAGKPEGFDEPRNAFAFMRPAKQGTVPQTMPVGDAYTEIKTNYLEPALQAFAEAYEEADVDARTKSMSGLDLQTRAQLEQWLDQDVAEDMRVEKYRAAKYADAKKDAAMLNYNQRYGFDPILTMISPYQFWYTRSMWKWAKRMIDKPALNNAYKRMQEYEDKNRQENLPSRLSGKWRISMPYLPDWMGGSYYVDLNSQLFPFSQFGQSYSSDMNTATLNARAEAILNEQVDLGQISVTDMQQALNDKKGSVWENAYAQAELEIGKQDQLNTLASQFISPNIFMTWYQKKQKGEDPGTLSGTRTGNAIKTLTSDIPLVSQLGSIVGDAMTLPEKALRKLYGYDYNEFGQYGDQQIRKQISQMCADGEITWRQALNAMNEKSGTIWDMAADRQRKEAMYKVPGFAGAQAAKEFVSGNANIGETLGTMAISAMSGGSILPSGEKTLREQKAARDQAYIDKANGDTEAVSRWYQENPEYTTRTATYIDDPEELLKYTLYQNISTAYYAQPYAQQQEIRNQLGPEFTRALLNKETRNYKAVPIEKLAEWNAAMGGKNPAVGSIDVQGVQQVMQLSNKTIDAVAEHDEIKNQRFPGISVIQNTYYDLPKDQRKAYLQQMPKLQEYWDWNRQYKNDHPEYVQWEEERSAYYNEETLYNSYADMSQYTQKQLDYAKATGNKLSEAAQYELQKLYQKYANPSFMSFEDYIKQLQDWD